MEYELVPRYSTRKSFYGKAKVIENGNVKELVSYSTIVARVTKEDNITTYEYLGHYSMTTTTHQKEFFKQEGLTDKEIKALINNGGKLVYEILK